MKIMVIADFDVYFGSNFYILENFQAIEFTVASNEMKVE